MSFSDYIECALWSSVDDYDNPLDDKYGYEDFDADLLKVMEEEYNAFIKQIKPIVNDYLSESQCAHDFWLTRNDHGTGFWSRGLGELGDELTAIAKSYGKCYLFIGDDDDRIYKY